MSKRFVINQQYGDRKKARLDISISDHNFPLSQNCMKESDNDNWGDDNEDEILLLASQACEEAYNESSILPDFSICMQPGSTSTQIEPIATTSKGGFMFKKPSNNPPRQLLQLQEENAKLKSENGKLLEKCVTKEGEGFYSAEKYKKLESNKLKLAQVTVGNNDILSSHRNNIQSNNSYPQVRKAKLSCTSVQTENHSCFLHLNMTHRKETSRLENILPLILESCKEHPISILDCNEKLQKHTDYSQNKCRIYSTYRIPSTPTHGEDNVRSKVQLSNIYEDLTYIAAENGDVASMHQRYLNVFKTVALALSELRAELELISERVTTAFQKEMDERYIESTSSFLCIDQLDLLKSKELFKDEQAIRIRRLMAVVAYLISNSKGLEAMNLYKHMFFEHKSGLIDCISVICCLLDSTSCAVLYSGFLVSTIFYLKATLQESSD
ncbi:hypothetical protein ACJJTC_006136 [Scirpophaga incertulas]